MKEQHSKSKICIFFENKFFKKNRLMQLNQALKIVGFDKIKESFKDIVEENKIRKLTSIEDSKLSEHIQKFRKVLEENFDKNDLNNFYYNIEWLKIKRKKHYLTNIFSNSDTLGVYDFVNNELSVSNSFIDDSIYHELFHLSSTNFDNKNYSLGFYIGFSYDIGEALNEGYTELLSQRYFNINDDDCYFFERIFAQALELIVGKEKMQSLYLNSNFFGLVDELKRYYSEDEIEKFLVSFDVVSKYSNKRIVTDEEVNKMNMLIEDMICFLLKGYIKSIKFKGQNLNYSEILIPYLQNLNIKYDIKGNNYIYNIERFNAVLKENLGEDYIFPLDILNSDKICYNK